MKQRKRYQRVLLKISGESLASPGGGGIDAEAVRGMADRIIEAAVEGVQIAVVVGGGNIIRGGALAQDGLVDRHTADLMGMLGTVMNGLALAAALREAGAAAVCQTALAVPGYVGGYERDAALAELAAGRMVVLAGGVGNPWFTTDTAGVLRAIELGCQAMLKATKVDGIYDSDPVNNPQAVRFDELTYDEILARRLGVMDLTAIAMARDNGLPVLVCSYASQGSIAGAVAGEAVGTIITA